MECGGKPVAGATPLSLRADKPAAGAAARVGRIGLLRIAAARVGWPVPTVVAMVGGAGLRRKAAYPRPLKAVSPLIAPVARVGCHRTPKRPSAVRRRSSFTGRDFRSLYPRKIWAPRPRGQTCLREHAESADENGRRERITSKESIQSWTCLRAARTGRPLSSPAIVNRFVLSTPEKSGRRAQGPHSFERTWESVDDSGRRERLTMGNLRIVNRNRRRNRPPFSPSSKNLI